MFGWLKKTASNADEVLTQTKKDISDTADKVQQVLDESGKNVNIIINVVLVALGVSIVGNIINVGLAISRHRNTTKPSVVIHNLYLKSPNDQL